MIQDGKKINKVKEDEKLGTRKNLKFNAYIFVNGHQLILGLLFTLLVVI